MIQKHKSIKSGVVINVKYVSGYLLYTLTNYEVIAQKTGSVPNNISNYSTYIGSKLSVQFVVKSKFKDKNVYFAQSPVSFKYDETPLTGNLKKELIYILSICRKRKLVKRLKNSKKEIFLKDILNMFYENEIEFPHLIATLFRCPIPTSDPNIIEAIAFYTTSIIYSNANTSKKQRHLEVKYIARYIRAYYSTLGIALDVEYISNIIKTSSVIVVENINSLEIAYPYTIAAKRKYVLSSLNRECCETSTNPGDLKNMLNKHKYLAITGSAGTGKTTLISNLIASSEENIVVTALTGKAATNYKDIRAVTLHKWLGWNGGGYTNNDTYCDVLVIDECSMITWEILHEVINRPHKKIIFVGDPNQLPPVRGENTFHTILSVLPKIHLNVTHRGDMDIKVKTVHIHEYFHYIEKFIDFVSKKKDKTWQILCPVYHGVVGIDTINSYIETKYDKKTLKRKVIVNKNIYNEYEQLLITNGTSGTVVADSSESVTILSDTNKNLYTVPKRIVSPAYCISIHKAQGCEWDYVLVLIQDNSPNSSRELFYTAQTRARIKTFVLSIKS